MYSLVDIYMYLIYKLLAIIILDYIYYMFGFTMSSKVKNINVYRIMYHHDE